MMIHWLIVMTTVACRLNTFYNIHRTYIYYNQLLYVGK